MINNIIFDIGNVLCNYAWPEMFLARTESQEMADRLAAATVNHPTWPEWDLGNMDYDALVEMMAANDPEIADVVRKVFVDIKPLLTKRDFAAPWVQALKAAGYRVFFLSNMSEYAYEQCPDAFAFLSFTDGGILSYKEHTVKPAEEIYRLLLSRYDLTSEESVFIDDSEQNIATAKRLGIHGIVFTTYEEAGDALRSLGVKY